MNAIAPITEVNAWSTAVPDWRDRIVAGKSLMPELPLYDAPAEKALRVFRRLRVPDLIGNPTYGEVSEPWVFDLVRAIFGSYDPETRKRMLCEFFVLVPKKNGKSALAAAIMVTAAILNERPNAELILVAPTQTISDISFKQAKGIIALDPDLEKIFHVKDHKKTIEHLTTGADLKILSADNDVITGSKAAYILIDETHVLASKIKAPDIYTELRGGMASRPEGFLLQITTQSKKPPSGQFRKELQRARDVRDGLLDLPLLPVLYELPPAMAEAAEWKKEETWGMVNPNLDRSVSLDFLRSRMIEAERDGPEAMALFASQHLNVQVGLGLHTDRWVAIEYWADNARKMNLQDLMDQCDVAVVGGDVGGLDDLFSLGVIGRHAETRQWLSWTRSWCVEAVLDLRKEIAGELRDFAEDGDLVITETAAEQAALAADICDRVRDAGLLPDAGAIGLDPYGAAALTDELGKRGYEVGSTVIGVGQGYKLSGAIKGIERRLIDGAMCHADQPILNWAIGNVKAEERGNNIHITKAAAGVKKIDPVIAIINAAVLMDMNPQAPDAGMDGYFAALRG